MAMRLILVTLFLPCAFPSALPRNQGKTTTLPPFKIPDITKFVGTPLPIWTYNSSSTVNTNCQVDVMVNMSRSHIVFNRWRYYHNTTRLSSLLDGNFESMLDTMSVGGLDMLATQIEQMVYESPDYQCAVIRVSLTSLGSPWYELRVRNSSITQGPNWGCEYNFKRLAKKGTRRYWDNCQNMLRQENLSRRST
uniref:p27 protein-like protein n=1 Tax=Amblyomma americanum TaxID=6943 RepID=B5M7B4_AMBAM